MKGLDGASSGCNFRGGSAKLHLCTSLALDICDSSWSCQSALLARNGKCFAEAALLAGKRIARKVWDKSLISDTDTIVHVPFARPSLHPELELLKCILLVLKSSDFRAGAGAAKNSCLLLRRYSCCQGGPCALCGPAKLHLPSGSFQGVLRVLHDCNMKTGT